MTLRELESCQRGFTISGNKAYLSSVSKRFSISLSAA